MNPKPQHNRRNDLMRINHRFCITLAACLLATGAAMAQTTVTTPEGAQLEVADDLFYDPATLTSAQISASTRELFAQNSMNVFRRFERDLTPKMVEFYTGALALRSLSPIKLAAGQQAGQNYDLTGGPTGGTGIRFFVLHYPDAAAVTARFAAAGLPAPTFTDAGGGRRVAMVDDPGGFPVQIVIDPAAKDNSDDGVGVGIGVSDLNSSRAFYREFVGLDELPEERDPVLGITRYPYRHAETTLYLYDVGTGKPANTGSAGIQYVVSDAPMVEARRASRDIRVQTPLNRMRGFDLVTVWLYDPDGVTNYFAQVGPSSRTAQARAAAAAPAFDPTVLPPIPNDYAPAKTSWGDPDFRGSWPIDHLNGLPLQRTEAQGNRHFLTDAEYAERQARIDTLAARYETEDSSGAMGQGHWVEMGDGSRRTSLLVLPQNGRMPAYTPEGQRRSDLMRSSWAANQPFDHWTDFDSWDRCITRGVPASMMPMMYNNGLRIFQSPGYVVIQMEMIHEARIIPIDGRDAIPAAVTNWLGESRGHWEDANTLVVETRNFRPGASATNIVTSGSPPENDTPTSEQAVLIERFNMTGPDSIVYETLYTDPVVFTQPWGTRLDWKRNDEYQFFEYACHEGNVQLRNYITASRAAREAAAAASAGAQ
jgi:catechol 2,3-dioxygenase-like lactoylglutathione lyase family enzyme